MATGGHQTGHDVGLVWPPFTLSGAFVDLQPNDAGVKIFSARMRRMIHGAQGSD